MKTSLTRGTIYLTISTFIFMVTGYITNVILGRFLGPGAFGTYGIILTTVGIINIIQTAGLPQALSKYVAEQEGKKDEILAAGLNIQIISTLLITGIFILITKPLSFMLHDPSILRYLLLSALVPPAYSFLSLFSGYYNGLHYFRQQAIMQIIYAIIKVTAVLLLAYYFKLYGAVFGLILAPLSALLYGFRFPSHSGKTFSYGKLISFSLPLIISAFLFTLLQSIDLYFIQAMLKSGASTGFYTANQTIAEIPFFALGAFASVIFPGISRSMKEKNHESVRSLIHIALRYMLILLIPGTLFIAVTSKSLVQLIYSERYIEAAPSLSVLVFASGFLTVFSVLIHILNGAGRPKLTLGITFIGVFLSAVSCALLIPVFGLTGAALSTALGGMTVMGISAFFVHRQFRALIPVNSVIKISTASLIVTVIMQHIPIRAVYLIPAYTIGGIAYAAILAVTHEISLNDWYRLKHMVQTG